MDGIEEGKKWKAESDLRTLKEAEIIKKDEARLKSAVAIADDEFKALLGVLTLTKEEKMFPSMGK